MVILEVGGHVVITLGMLGQKEYILDVTWEYSNKLVHVVLMVTLPPLTTTMIAFSLLSAG